MGESHVAFVHYDSPIHFIYTIIFYFIKTYDIILTVLNKGEGMKKLMFALPVLMCAACASDYKEFDNHFSGCERIETSAQHLIYKCPADQEWIVAVKAQEPNGMFKTGGGQNLDELYADTENVYVEVAFNDAGVCAEDYTIRTMIAAPVADKMWAFIGCK